MKPVTLIVEINRKEDAVKYTLYKILETIFENKFNISSILCRGMSSESTRSAQKLEVGTSNLLCKVSKVGLNGKNHSTERWPRK
jgi:hypothetical protein